MLVCVLIQFASPLRNGSQDRCFSFFNGSQDDVLFFFLKVLISIFYVSWLNKCCFSLFLLYYRKELSKTLCDGEIVHLHFKPACIKRKKTLGLKLCDFCQKVLSRALWGVNIQYFRYRKQRKDGSESFCRMEFLL